MKLKPAICYKQELIAKFQACYYTEAMFYESATIYGNWYPDLDDDGCNNGRYNWAIIDDRDPEKEKIVGFVGYNIDYYSSNVYGFILISFEVDPNNFKREVGDSECNTIKCNATDSKTTDRNTTNPAAISNPTISNPTIGLAIRKLIKMFKNDYHLHRIEWCCVGGNPVERHYDKFCERMGGRKLVLKDAMKDKSGKYRDRLIYEVILDRDITK